MKGFSRHQVFNAAIGGQGLKLNLRDGGSGTLGAPEPGRLTAFLDVRMRR